MPSAVVSSPAVSIGAEQPRLAPSLNAGKSDHTLAVVEADLRQRRVALSAIVLSGLVFLAALPFLTQPLTPVFAFVPAYEASLVILDLITAVLLCGQFAHQRSAAILVIAAGYLFDAFQVVPHALSYPGLLTPAGWLSGGAQTTAWLYMFWHGGFPIFVIAYALMRQRGVTVAASGAGRHRGDGDARAGTDGGRGQRAVFVAGDHGRQQLHDGNEICRRRGAGDQHGGGCLSRPLASVSGSRSLADRRDGGVDARCRAERPRSTRSASTSGFMPVASMGCSRQPLF